jgi:Na+-transporting NADH:ubiquinone oxidoreductase subunit C
MPSDRYTIGYAAIVCLLSSLLLALASAGLKPRQDQMAELDRKFNVLKAFQAEVVDAAGRRIPGPAIEKLYADHVEELVLDPATAEPLAGKSPRDFTARQVEAKEVLPLYRWREGDRVEKYALPVSGKGLWSTIYGYLALDGRAANVVGVSFYRHGETPGLGGEVEKGWFQENFKGLAVFADGRPRRIKVAKGKVGGQRVEGDAGLVDGISGATLTGDGVTRFLNGDLERYGRYFAGVRKG